MARRKTCGGFEKAEREFDWTTIDPEYLESTFYAAVEHDLAFARSLCGPLSMSGGYGMYHESPRPPPHETYTQTFRVDSTLFGACFYGWFLQTNRLPPDALSQWFVDNILRFRFQLIDEQFWDVVNLNIDVQFATTADGDSLLHVYLVQKFPPFHGIAFEVHEEDDEPIVRARGRRGLRSS
jgi:hypothetical protein